MQEKVATASKMYNNACNFTKAYQKAIQPIAKKYNLLPMAFDIMMFLYNNPAYNNAKDITKMRGFKPGIVSFHVDNLVNEGYLERKISEDDRRKITLIITSKSEKLIKDGIKIQQKFSEKLVNGISNDELEVFKKCIDKFDKNVELIIKNGL